MIDARLKTIGHSLFSCCVAVLLAVGPTGATAVAQESAAREWSDATGKFKIVAKLLEVKNDVALLRTNNGKTIRIPVARLCQADQEFLKGGDNPFEEIDSADAEMSAEATASGGSAAEDTDGWNSDLKIDWENVEELDRSFDGEWKFELPAQSDLGFTPKRASLNKKTSFFEDIRRFTINPIAQRAVVGYTVTFSVPKPQSRLALVDLVSGKATHTSAVDGDMGPLALLNDGSTVLMFGTGSERSGSETSDQVQLWRLNGKKVIQSKTWVPFPDESESWGKKSNGVLVDAIPLPNDRLILLSGNGHLVCIDAATRNPYWHTKLSGSFAIDASVDRSLLAIADGHLIMIVDPQAGVVKSSIFLDDKPHMAFPHVRWSPNGTCLLVSFANQLRVLDLKSGEWTQKCELTGVQAISSSEMIYPHDDFALLGNRLLVHIPSQIKVCDYRDGPHVKAIGGTTFIAMQSAEGGILVPSKMPHPAAEKMLAQAQTDPSVFLIHPGVEVSVNASGAGQWASQASQFLSKAATAAGYKVVANAPISIVASVTGPKQEAISYIAAGAYIANVYTSSLKLTYQGNDLWSTSGDNTPGFLQTTRGESIQDKLNELGKTPNLSVFEHAQFPKLLQKPSEEKDQKKSGNQLGSLMISTFTMQGLVDSK